MDFHFSFRFNRICFGVGLYHNLCSYGGGCKPKKSKESSSSSLSMHGFLLPPKFIGITKDIESQLSDSDVGDWLKLHKFC